MMLLLASGAARAKDPVAEGRYHLRKANGLAGDDHCRAAIREYTLAYQKLHDPVVLFNRAECYRRIGQGPEATADYRAFLEAVPAAPNRSEIEAKIVALAALSAPPPPAPIAATSPPRPPRSPATRPTVRSTEPPPVQPVAAARPPAVPVIDLPELVVVPPPASAEQPTVALVQTGASPQADTESHHGRSWIWIALGAAVAGGAVGAYFALRPPATVPPTTALGNYKF